MKGHRKIIIEIKNPNEKQAFAGKATVELAVMGVLQNHHRSGLGRQLVERAKETARSQVYELMQVKTVKMGIFGE